MACRGKMGRHVEGQGGRTFQQTQDPFSEEQLLKRQAPSSSALAH